MEDFCPPLIMPSDDRNNDIPNLVPQLMNNIGETPLSTEWLTESISLTLEQLADQKKEYELGPIATRVGEIISNMNHQIDQDIIDETYIELIRTLNTRKGEDEARTRPSGRRRIKPLSANQERKAYKFARTQHLFKDCPKLLAKMVIDDTIEAEMGPKPEVNIDPDIVKKHYTDLWGIKGPYKTSSNIQTAQQDPSTVLLPFSMTEVGTRIRRIRSRVAAGIDGLKKGDLLKKGFISEITAFYNLVLIAIRPPSQWNYNTTTLILKEGKDPTNPASYRPITLASILGRVYWGLIDERLKGITDISSRQKGFTTEQGCFNNVNILNEVIKTAKKKKGLTVIQIDISNAFDSLPHELIHDSLRAKAVPEEVRFMIKNAYANAYTTLKCNTNPEIPIKRGVKQGDPLSPLLFNTCIDEVIRDLENMDGFSLDNKQNVSCLAFADDIILLADTAERARTLLAHLEDFLIERHMAIAPSKCTTFEIVAANKSWYVQDPVIEAKNGFKVAYLGPTTPTTYLGIQLTPWIGTMNDNAISKLRKSLPKIKKLALRPHQKVDLLAGYVIPHFLTMTPISITCLQTLDRELRVAVKEYLHLPLSTADGLLYTKKRDGGLGFPRIETLVIATTLKAGWSFINNQDPIIQALSPQSDLEIRMKKHAYAAHLGWPIKSIAEINKYKSKKRVEEQVAWESLPSQGKGVSAYKDDRVGNCWLYKPNLLKPGRYISALRLRANVAGNKVSLNRATKTGDIFCRQCKVLPETLGHILGLCIHTKEQRIHRHNEIRDVLESRLAERAEVFKEMTLEDPDKRRLQPDLVIHDQGRVLVADVTICHEDGGLLTRGKEEKLTKYGTLKDTLLKKFRGESFLVLPIVIGTRGTMPKDTISALKILGIEDRGTLTTLSLIALRSSVEMYHTFLDYDKRGLGSRCQNTFVRPD